MKKLFLAVAILLLVVSITLAQTGMKKKRPLPDEYGRSVISNYSAKAGLSPVVFEHWLHRSMFSCRLCHVDIGFALENNATGIKASDNAKGYYCGACHNGTMVYGGVKVFASCSPGELSVQKSCEKCHSEGRDVKKIFDFASFTAKFPRERFGNGTNWEKTEAEGLIKPIDTMEGISVKRAPLPIPKDYSIDAKVAGMPKVLFSHKKHASWNGCELCHPDLFGVKPGVSKISMTDIFEGKYCGTCHGKVSFPLIDCQRCHSEPVQ
ncbi:MAG: c(7)-type cytochrome triheme domain-containing protein [Thermodesulfovibrionales bacterium]